VSPSRHGIPPYRRENTRVSVERVWRGRVIRKATGSLCRALQVVWLARASVKKEILLAIRKFPGEALTGASVAFSS
jgi:hypothetical protein